MRAFQTVPYNRAMNRTERYTIALGERGRLVLPARLRQRLDLQPGDRLLITVDAEGGFHVVSARAGPTLVQPLPGPRSRAFARGRADRRAAGGRALMDETAGAVLDASAVLAYLRLRVADCRLRREQLRQGSSVHPAYRQDPHRRKERLLLPRNPELRERALHFPARALRG